MRELTDPSTIRALTHPVRLALLEVLATEGALTATEAGELIGESPTTCSFHFRQLEKYGFTEVAATGPGRQRRWKIAQLGMNFSDTTDDAELNIAATGLSRLVTDRAIARMQQFQDTKSNFPKEWQEVSESTEAVLFVTPSELAELNEQVLAVLMRYHSRLTEIDQRPEGSLPVEVLVFRYPVRFSGAAQ
ncbi:MAG TPA: helix-turn-helix domain-containing protein [Acidimicrobiales bacterium]|nr:helix-turn-helix domain-containing protein [Acidimicrobiales bacterium]